MLAVRGAGHDEASLFLVAVVAAAASFLSGTRKNCSRHRARVLPYYTGAHEHDEAGWIARQDPS